MANSTQRGAPFSITSRAHFSVIEDQSTGWFNESDGVWVLYISGTEVLRYTSTGAVSAGLVDLNGVADALVLDADGDTTISAPTDDQIDIEVAGADVATFTNEGLVVATGYGVQQTAQALTPNNDSGAASTISEGVTAVDVGAVTTDANDWIVLPTVANVPVGHQIRIACNAGTNFELRTPAASGEKINTVDSDGTQEYLCVDAEVVVVTKVSDTDGWAAYDIPALGGVGTATIPD
jgi:hypothetical protein